jgi:hypothetical protein
MAPFISRVGSELMSKLVHHLLEALFEFLLQELQIEIKDIGMGRETNGSQEIR